MKTFNFNKKITALFISLVAILMIPNYATAENSVNSISISPNYAKDSTIFIGTTKMGIFKSTNRAKSWQRVNDGLILPSGNFGNVDETNLSPNYKNDNICLASATSTSSSGSGVFIFKNSVKKWIKRTRALIFENFAYSPDFANDKTVFASYRLNRIFKSTNKGISWVQLAIIGPNKKPSIKVRQIIISPNFTNDQTIFAATTEGIYKSANGGKNWVISENGLSAFGHIVNSIACSPNYSNDKTVFAATFDGIFRSTDNGESWEKLSGGLPDASVENIVISSTFSTDRTIFANAVKDNWSIDDYGLYKSVDGGQNWQTVNSGLRNKSISTIAISPNFSIDQTIFIGTDEDGIFKSANGGNSWKQANKNIAKIKTIIKLSVSSKTVGPNDKVTVTGQLLTKKNKLIAGVRTIDMYYGDELDWYINNTFKTNNTGNFSFSFQPKKTGYLDINFDGDINYTSYQKSVQIIVK